MDPWQHPWPISTPFLFFFPSGYTNPRVLLGLLRPLPSTPRGSIQCTNSPGPFSVVRKAMRMDCLDGDVRCCMPSRPRPSGSSHVKGRGGSAPFSHARVFEREGSVESAWEKSVRQIPSGQSAKMWRPLSDEVTRTSRHSHCQGKGVGGRRGGWGWEGFSWDGTHQWLTCMLKFGGGAGGTSSLPCCLSKGPPSTET